MMTREVGAVVEEDLAGLPGKAMPPPRVSEPRRLWSLLEIMNSFSPQVFLKLNMLIENLGHFASGVSDQKPDSTASVQRIKERVRKSFDVEGLVYLCAFHGLTASRITAEKIDRLDASASLEQLCNLVNELQGRLIDELSEPRFFEVSDEEAGFYNNPRKGWEPILDRFPTAIRDVEEASKTFAFGRHIACVFHLMRVLELGLRTLGKSLNDPSLDPKRNPSWRAILHKCDIELGKALQDRSPEWKTDDVFFSTATANLRAVQYAWRNPTMHIERTYNEEEAREVYLAARAFMRHLATKLSEESVLDSEIPA